MNRTHVDVHVLQVAPPSNINRDDTGSPKTAVYGGVMRARVSSQAWKRAMRQEFSSRFDEHELGVRTKDLLGLVSAEIVDFAPEQEEDAEKLAKNILTLAGISFKPNKSKDGEEAEALFFIGRTQAKKLAELAVTEGVTKKEAQQALQSGSAVDVALFGRMAASAPELNTDACSQVAHALSVHRVDTEYDYFTAVDDLSPEDNAGAGMIGAVEYNSSTLYRYATVAAHALCGQLGSAEATGKAVAEFVRAFLVSMPSGKKNTFANGTLPSAVLVTIREDQGVNLVGAFEEAVPAEGALAAASEKLAGYATELYDAWSGQPVKSYTLCFGNIDAKFTALGDKKNLNDLISEIHAVVAERISEA